MWPAASVRPGPEDRPCRHCWSVGGAGGVGGAERDDVLVGLAVMAVCPGTTRVKVGGMIGAK